MKPFCKVTILDNKKPRYRNGFGYRYNCMSKKKKLEKIKKARYSHLFFRMITTAYLKDLRKANNGKLYINMFSCAEAVYAFTNCIHKYLHKNLNIGRCVTVRIDDKMANKITDVYVICVHVPIMREMGFTMDEIKFVYQHEVGHIECGRVFSGRYITQEFEADLFAARKVGFEPAITFLSKYRELNDVDIKTGKFFSFESFNEINKRLEHLRSVIAKEKLNNK